MNSPSHTSIIICGNLSISDRFFGLFRIDANRVGLRLQVCSSVIYCATINLNFCSCSASLQCLTEKPPVSNQKQMAEQRQGVVNELINTEKDYCNDLDLCVKYFLHELQTIQVGFLQHSVLHVRD